MKIFFSKIKRLAVVVTTCVKKQVAYCTKGVWSDTRRSLKVNIVKTLNLSVRSFFNGDIQSKACAMTFRTMLAIVPALALLFAIGRGFGLQEVIKDELIENFSTQTDLLERAFGFVDSYLGQSSGGVFVGVGIVLLLWTLISLVGSVETAFNSIWGVKEGRSVWRKVTDYLAIFLILPVLMICSSGITVFVSSTVEAFLPFEFISPLMSVLLDVASLVLICLFFTGVYILIPNARVKFRNAFIAGVLAGTAYMILQWLFISGQLYVSKYNAIYGSFAFLPLFLIWLQLVWVICLSGAVVCYASQNIFMYNFIDEISKISLSYRSKIVVSVMAVVVNSYVKGRRPITEMEITAEYGLPPSLVTSTVNTMVGAGLLLRVVNNPKIEVYGLVPAVEPAMLTVGEVLYKIRNYGASDFVPDFHSKFSDIDVKIDSIESSMITEAGKILVKDLSVRDLTAEMRSDNKPI